MAFITADSSLMQLVAVRANNAPEMQLRLQEALAGVSDSLTVQDVQLVGCGGAPNFLAVATIAGSEGNATPISDPTATLVLGAEAIDPIELSEQIQAALIADGIDDILLKCVSAGGGFGPHWMSVALYVPVPQG